MADQASIAQPPGWRALTRSPLVLGAVVCIVLAALSAAVLPTVPSYDPWSWIVWGREVFDPHLSFAITGGPSWKPLPVIFTAVWGVFGSAGPTLWVITARAGGLLGLLAAYRLAVVLCRQAGFDEQASWSGPLAGAFAAAGVGLTQDWAYYMYRGTSEPILIGASLLAVERLVAGRRMPAFWLSVAGSLIRPEAWPFTLILAVWVWRADRRQLVWLVIGLVSIPFFWFVPPWVGSGQPLLAATHAADYNGHLGSDPFLTVLHRGADLQVLTMLVLGLVATGLAWWRGRDRAVLMLAAGALAWWVLVVAMTLDGYPGLERFFLPAAAVICVLGGVGLVRLALLAGDAATEHRALAWAAAVVALIAISIPFSTSRIAAARAQRAIAARAVIRLDQLGAAVAAVGGHPAVYPCHSSFAAVNHGVQTALAWKLHTTLGRVGTKMRRPGVLFVGPHDSIDGGPAPVSHRLDRVSLLARVGAWRVYRVWRAGHSLRCVGR
ncbi:MAG: hypothetical protein ACYC91_12090 [Solirubrobacteraceae bacterium]